MTDLYGEDFNAEAQVSWHKFCMILIRKIIDGINECSMVKNEDRLEAINEETEDDCKEDRLPVLIISFFYQFGRITVTFLDLVYYLFKSRLMFFHQ